MKLRVKRHAVVQPPDKAYRFLPLTQGLNAIVDAEDFDWLNQWNWRAVWLVVGRTFIAVSGNGNNILLMHRVITHCSKEKQVDHKNHNTLDNRKINLRFCTSSENCRNRKKPHDNRSGFKGVCWDKDRGQWRSYICVDGKQKHIGLFTSLKDAALSYDQAARLYFGDFACLNFP